MAKGDRFYFPFSTRDEAMRFQDEQVKVLQRHKLIGRFSVGMKHIQGSYVVILIQKEN
jgi:hypothetical protein